MVPDGVLTDQIAAISCGIYAGNPVCDLDYAEDSEAETDANFVMTGSGGIVEVQATAEGAPFDAGSFQTMMDLASGGINQLLSLQKIAVG